MSDHPRVRGDGGKPHHRSHEFRARFTQLGHSSTEVTLDRYIAKTPIPADLSMLLETLAQKQEAHIGWSSVTLVPGGSPLGRRRPADSPRRG